MVQGHRFVTVFDFEGKEGKGMQIGNMDEFRIGQLVKAEKRKEEDKKIQKGIYQMHVMVEGECMDTLNKEQEKIRRRQEAAKGEKEGTETEKKAEQKTEQKMDIQTEAEKLLSMGSKHYYTMLGKE